VLVPGLELEADVLGAVAPGKGNVTVTVIVLTGIPALELKIDVMGLELEADVLGAVAPGKGNVTVTVRVLNVTVWDRAGGISVTVLTGVPALELKIDVTVWDRAGGIRVTVLTSVPVLLESKFDVTV
jgi:hypothetical protein